MQGSELPPSHGGLEERRAARRDRNVPVIRGWRVAVPAIVALGLALAACGDDGDGGDGGGSGGGATTATKAAAHVGKSVAIVIPSDDGYYRVMGCGAREEGKRLGFDVGEVQVPEGLNNTQKQASVVTSVLARNPDALVFTPTDAKASAAPIKSAVADGLKVANVDAQLEDESLYETFVSSSHHDGGVLGGKLLAEQIGGEGKVLAIGMIPSHPITRGRIGGFEEALKEYPGIEYIGARYPEIDIAKAAAEVAGVLRGNPDIKAIYTTNYLGATGAVTALRDAGLADEVKVITWDLMPAVIKLLRSGEVTGTVVQKPKEMGKLAVQQLANAFDGKPVQKEVGATITTATSENVDSPEMKELYYVPDC